MIKNALIAAYIILCFSNSKAQNVCIDKNKKTNKYEVAVYYFPQWHVDAQNEKTHGYPWTEWETLKTAKPKFTGHRQPKIPLWGYEDEADPKVMAKKIDVASSHGIDIFLYDWYYTNDGPFLQTCLEDGFLKAANKSKLKFAIMWANHLEVTPATFDNVIDICINKYFKDPSYWKEDGCPYFSIYQLFTFINGFGSVEKAVAALQKFRDKTKAAGFKDLHLNAVQWGLHMPENMPPKEANELIDLFHISSVDSYVWIHHTDMPAFPVTTYDYMMKKAVEYWATASKQFKVPYHPNVTMGWDASPRCDTIKPWVKGEYPFFSILTGNIPAKFKQSLQSAKGFVDAQKSTHKIITINSWNEWTEGSYLEPDTVNKLQYLKAIKQVFNKNY